MDCRLRHALFAAGLAVAVSVGVVLGNGHPTVRHSHMLAFANNNSLCPDRPAGGCKTLYVLDGDSVPQDLPGLGPVPATAKSIAKPLDDIVGLSWAPDANSVAYLVGRRVRTANNYYLIDSIDLWQVHIASQRNELIAKDVASDQEDLEYRLELAIQWLGDRPVMAGKQSWRPDTRKTDEEFLAPDKKLTAMRAQGFDSNSICVRTPQAVRSDSLGPGCFGDGFFTEPVWAPF